MYKNFDEMIRRAAQMPKKLAVAVCAADDDSIVHLAGELQRLALCRCILVGDADKIRALAAQSGTDISAAGLIDEKDRVQSCLRAVKLVHDGQAQVFVKGNVNTSDFLRAVLNKEVGLRTGRKLSVLSAYEVPGEKKIFFITDGGMIPAPDLETKAMILRSAVPVLQQLGIRQPKVAILAANERPTPGMQATLDARDLCEMAARGELPDAVYEGPIAFDVAMKSAAAKIKGIDSRVSGDVDLFLVPSIETGNCLGKAIGYFGKGTMAGQVVGATHPVIMSSRAASIRSKLASVAWALLSYKDHDDKGGDQS